MSASKNKSSENQDRIYPRILVRKSIRKFLITSIIIATAISGAVIYVHMQRETHWLPIILLGSISGVVLLLIPSSETWVYTPWQKSPQRVERHDGW